MKFDYVLVGGGLQSALMALAIVEPRGQSRARTVAIIEQQATLGGNHLWSFHASDVSEEARAWVEPLIEHRFAGYQVAFPDLTRTLDAPYASVTSARLDRVVRAAIEASPGSAMIFGRAARAISARSVTLDDGAVIEAKVVVDARGPQALAPVGRVAYQKFVGLELELARPHAMRRPMLIDARVAQLDGFRFVYTLPLAADRVLVEDTVFSDTPHLDVEAMHARALKYAAAQGLAVASVVRVETGVLPLPLDAIAPPSSEGVLRAGYGGGWFHPTTGYSFPAAVRLALHVSRVSRLSRASNVRDDDVHDGAYRALVDEHMRQVRFGLLLNRLLFDAMPSIERWRVLERFYRLPEPTIRRFYAMTTTATDRARIVCGRPPRGISLRAALSSLRHRPTVSP